MTQSNTEFNQRLFQHSMNLMTQDGSFDTTHAVIANMMKREDNTMSTLMNARRPVQDEEKEDLVIQNLEHLLRSGFHPKFLETEDVKRLRQRYGKKWKQHFGYN